MRLIDADALLANRQILRGEDVIGIRDYVTVAEIENAPTIEPERETGEWERHYSRLNVYADLYWHCSKCGYKNDDQYANVYHKFCPNCGARMSGGEPCN